MCRKCLSQIIWRKPRKSTFVRRVLYNVPPTDLSRYYQISLQRHLLSHFWKETLDQNMNRNSWRIHVVVSKVQRKWQVQHRLLWEGKKKTWKQVGWWTWLVRRHISKHTSHIMKSGGGMINVKRNAKRYIICRSKIIHKNNNVFKEQNHVLSSYLLNFVVLPAQLLVKLNSCSILSLLTAIKGCLSEFGLFSFGRVLSSQLTPYQVQTKFILPN